MPYTITDAMQDELEFLRELAEVEKKRDKFILEAIYREIANSHQRILNRVNSGLDYSLEIVNGEIERVAKKSNRKTLEQEYPALKKAAEQYDIVEKLVNSTPDD
jgi:hemerythrin-like domain-containing protein